MILGPFVADLALKFSAPEYLALYIFAVTAVCSLVGNSMVKALLAMVFGLMISTIGEDFRRHQEDLSFDAMEECWGSNQIKAPGCHPIQLLYQAFINHTSIEKVDVLVTNLFWQRSPSSKDLIIDDKLEKICRDGFLLNTETHQPETICFLGHETAKHVIDMGWSDICLLRGSSKYPWGENQKIKNYRMKFNGKSINTFSIPHPSRFGFGNSHERLSAIINALTKNCGT